MVESGKRLEEYRKTGYYYIPTETSDLLWIDETGKWTMNASAVNMRSCMELDRVPHELDEGGREIILREFGIKPDDYELEQIRYVSPLKLENSKSRKW
jgi:hypothetical protein